MVNNNTWYKIFREVEGNNSTPLIIDARFEINGLHPATAALRAVENITKNYPAPYTLLCSGGIDSQFMIWAWKISGKEFSILLFDYDGKNYHDTKTLIEFCERENLNLGIDNFDVDTFISSAEYIEMAKRYTCASPHILTYIKFSQGVPGTILMSGNYIGGMQCGLNYTILGLQRYASIDRGSFIPFFLMHDPELAYSFFSYDTEFKKTYFEDTGHQLSDYDAKYSAYRWAGAPVIKQEKKYTGFEKIKESYDNAVVPIKLRLQYQNKSSKRPFDLLYRYSLHDHIGDYSDSSLVRHNYSNYNDK